MLEVGHLDLTSDSVMQINVKPVFVGRALMPSVNMLQQLIEKAWAAGFDEAGRQQLRGKVVGTRKWIGATEIYAVLSFLHVRYAVTYTNFTAVF